jgi:hypothetical protein
LDKERLQEFREGQFVVVASTVQYCFVRIQAMIEVKWIKKLFSGFSVSNCVTQFNIQFVPKTRFSCEFEVQNQKENEEEELLVYKNPSNPIHCDKWVGIIPAVSHAEAAK